MQPLPIDPRLPEIVAALRAGSSLVLVAEPGAGKTTRVPRALFDAGLAEGGEILVLEPRRLAARMAARRVAEELGERVGERVGFQVRFEDVSSSRTKIRFVTEGILTRRLGTDPGLRGVSVVVLDEFHERHLHADVALALVRRLQRGARPDLRLVVMSATLDADAVAAYLGAQAMHVEGRRFEVELEHADKRDERPLEQQVASAVRKLVVRGLDGDVLVFLPGAAEIRRAREACDEIARSAGLEVVMLHGDLPAAEQDRAVRRDAKPKIILSTNVAETSITIEGVAAVVDSGLARVAGHSPWSGMPTLETKPVSRASATQRAGRAGRVRAGRCLRLYTKQDHDTRPAHDVAEIRRVDLAETVLLLRASGERDLAGFGWLEVPPAAALDAAEVLLARLGAVDASGEATDLGRKMLTLPLHPRAARLVCEAVARNVGARGALLAALLGEREIRVQARMGAGGRAAATDEVAQSDLVARLEAFEAVEVQGLAPDRIRAHDLDVGATLAVGRARDQIARIIRARDVKASLYDEEQALLVSTLAAFPDRVAKRRDAKGADVVFAGGGSAKLAPTSMVKEAPFLVAVDADERRGQTLVRLASGIEPEWLLEMFPERVVDRRDVRFEAAAERVVVLQQLVYDGLVLDESRSTTETGPEVERVLAEAALAAGASAFCDPDELDRLRRRVRFAALHVPAITPIDDDALRAAMLELCAGRRSFAELRETSLLDVLRARLGQSHVLLDRMAPERVTLPGGRRVTVAYEADKPPWIESRLQDFFGMADSPRVADGRVPLVVHLLAPNQRAVQVTSDLAGFWDRHYPAIRRELMRRYPRHSWPEDPLHSTPPPPRPPRR